MSKEVSVMRNGTRITRSILLAAAVLLLGFSLGAAPRSQQATGVHDGPAAAEGASKTVAERMIARLDAVNDLKRKGLVGENNTGFLEERRTLTGEQEDILKAENRDRRQVYKSIADQTDTSMEVVGRQRARQIAERSVAGIWVQNESGLWYRTK